MTSGAVSRPGCLQQAQHLLMHLLATPSQGFSNQGLQFSPAPETLKQLQHLLMHLHTTPCIQGVGILVSEVMGTLRDLYPEAGAGPSQAPTRHTVAARAVASPQEACCRPGIEANILGFRL